MSYWIDRQRAFLDTEIVAVLSVRGRGIRSRLVLCDGSLHQTLTRPRTIRRKLKESHGETSRQS